MTRLDLEPSGLAVLTIAAGPLNLYTAELHRELDAALDRLSADTRALLIRAEGRIVSGGSTSASSPSGGHRKRRRNCSTG